LTPDQRHAVLELKRDCEEMTSPLRYMEHVLHPWVAFVIMPIFALANAGVALGGDMGATLTQPVTLAVLLGLWIGKPIGVFSFAYVAVKVGFARLPNNTNWQQVFGVSCLCGIGFTMSLFIASLAFEDAFLLDSSKIGIFAASVLSALGGALLIITASRKPQPTEPHAGVM
jgi:NhaA family Na+:H+ antiporter